MVVSAISVAVYNVVWVLIIVPVIFLIGFYLVKTFIRTLRETARVESVTNSPVLTHLGETIAGASTIRAFDKIDHFKKNHFGLQDTNLLAMIFNKGMRSWFNVRINLISQLIILFSFTYCVSVFTDWLPEFVCLY